MVQYSKFYIFILLIILHVISGKHQQHKQTHNYYNNVTKNFNKTETHHNDTIIETSTKNPPGKAIIDVPIIPCKPGQKRDLRGRCRKIFRDDLEVNSGTENPNT